MLTIALALMYDISLIDDAVVLRRGQQKPRQILIF